jgi:molybdopterin converting factor small subunit
MSITIQLTYDMSKALGVPRFEIDGVRSVREAVDKVQERFGAGGEEFAKLSRVAAVAVNGVLVNHRRGMRTALEDGDVVAFVKAAAGG